MKQLKKDKFASIVELLLKLESIGVDLIDGNDLDLQLLIEIIIDFTNVIYVMTNFINCQ